MKNKELEFCPKCKKALVMREEDKITYATCICGYEKETKAELYTSEREKRKKVGQGIAIDTKNLEGFPHKCSKCGYGQSEVTDLGASYSDESNTYLFKCKKCGYSERQADGTGN
jgi:DNA-directed RNA polymerase subunit M/transcription elongation factor TFIIS